MRPGSAGAKALLVAVHTTALHVEFWQGACQSLVSWRVWGLGSILGFLEGLGFRVNPWFLGGLRV